MLNPNGKLKNLFGSVSPQVNADEELEKLDVEIVS